MNPYLEYTSIPVSAYLKPCVEIDGLCQVPAFRPVLLLLCVLAMGLWVLCSWNIDIACICLRIQKFLCTCPPREKLRRSIWYVLMLSGWPVCWCTDWMMSSCSLVSVVGMYNYCSSSKSWASFWCLLPLFCCSLNSELPSVTVKSGANITTNAATLWCLFDSFCGGRFIGVSSSPSLS